MWGFLLYLLFGSWVEDVFWQLLLAILQLLRAQCGRSGGGTWWLLAARQVGLSRRLAHRRPRTFARFFGQLGLWSDGYIVWEPSENEENQKDIDVTQELLQLRGGARPRWADALDDELGQDGPHEFADSEGDMAGMRGGGGAAGAAATARRREEKGRAEIIESFRRALKALLELPAEQVKEGLRAIIDDWSREDGAAGVAGGGSGAPSRQPNHVDKAEGGGKAVGTLEAKTTPAGQSFYSSLFARSRDRGQGGGEAGEAPVAARSAPSRRPRLLPGAWHKIGLAD
jgi:hypothetical protein